MSNQNMSNIPGMGAMTDTLEFVKGMWGGMKIPGMVMPTLSVDEINKQIADLKTVESWLTLNMNMLRGTIQTLEVQSATIATLQSMSATIGSKTNSNGAEQEPPSGSPFSFAEPTAAKTSATGQGTPGTASQASPQTANAAANLIPPFADPATWWNLLQDQFKQAVNTAMTPPSETPATKRTAAKESSAKPSGETPPRATPSTSRRKSKPKAKS